MMSIKIPHKSYGLMTLNTRSCVLMFLVKASSEPASHGSKHTVSCATLQVRWPLYVLYSTRTGTESSGTRAELARSGIIVYSFHFPATINSSTQPSSHPACKLRRSTLNTEYTVCDVVAVPVLLWLLLWKGNMLAE